MVSKRTISTTGQVASTIATLTLGPLGGLAVGLGAGLLGSLFGSDNSAELAAFQAELNKQAQDIQRSSRRADIARQDVIQSFGQAAEVEHQIPRDIIGALDRFL